MYEELLKTGRIHSQRVSKPEIRRALQRADRDLKTAIQIMATDCDWDFAVAYNAILQASRAYMFAQGYRPAGTEGHKNTFAFLLIALGEKYRDLITYFDRMRNKRNQAIYDVAGLITETEAEQILSQARKYVALIRSLLKKSRKI